MDKPQTAKQEVQAPPRKTPVYRTDNLRVLRETKKKVAADLAVLNRKDFGRRITSSDYVALAISLVRPEHLEQLRDASLSNEDRLKLRFQEYCDKNGKVSRDEFLGILLAGGREGTV